MNAVRKEILKAKLPVFLNYTSMEQVNADWVCIVLLLPYLYCVAASILTNLGH